MERTVEDDAREMLDRMGVEGALEMSSGDVVELANNLSELYGLRAENAALKEQIEFMENCALERGEYAD